MDQQQKENRRIPVPHKSTYLYGSLSFATSWGKGYLNFRGRDIGMPASRSSPDERFGWEIRSGARSGLFKRRHLISAAGVIHPASRAIITNWMRSRTLGIRFGHYRNRQPHP